MITTAIPLGHRLTAVLETGFHPATRQPTMLEATCGQCTHRIEIGLPHADGAARTRCSKSAYRRYGPNLPAQTPACALYKEVDHAA